MIHCVRLWSNMLCRLTLTKCCICVFWCWFYPPYSHLAFADFKERSQQRKVGYPGRGGELQRRAHSKEKQFYWFVGCAKWQGEKKCGEVRKNVQQVRVIKGGDKNASESTGHWKGWCLLQIIQFVACSASN